MSAAPADAGRRWGGARLALCPHCGVERTLNHQPLCKSNPNRIVRIPPRAAAIRAAKLAAASKPPSVTPMPEPAPPAQPAAQPAPPTPQPVAQQPAQPAPQQAAPAAAPREVPFAIRDTATADPQRFLADRVAELRQQAPQPVTPPSVAVKPQQRGAVTFTPSPLLIKLALGGLALGLGVMVWRALRDSSVEDRAKAQQAKGRKAQEAAISQEPQRYTGPRAWTPEPERVSSDVLPGPANLGGGYVPSPQSEWGQRQDEQLRGRAGRP